MAGFFVVMMSGMRVGAFRRRRGRVFPLER
jgi:hypothetical protein